jgi:hypothetical protein
MNHCLLVAVMHPFSLCYVSFVPTDPVVETPPGRSISAELEAASSGTSCDEQSDAERTGNHSHRCL